MNNERLIQNHGGYHRLKSFQISRMVYDLTVLFCNQHVDRFSRSRDQMVQAARSGVQNIAEGSQASATSKKTEIKLTQVARASLEELKLDYEDFLRQNKLSQWPIKCQMGQNLIDHRYQSVQEILSWIDEISKNGKQSPPETMANTILVLTRVACSLLDRQVVALARSFEDLGGFSERLYRVRRSRREK